MSWYWIVILTVICVHAVNTVIAIIGEFSKSDEREIIPFLCFTVYFPLWFLTYPLRAISRYKLSQGFYKKHNISIVAYLFGKRPKN